MHVNAVTTQWDMAMRRSIRLIALTATALVMTAVAVAALLGTEATVARADAKCATACNATHDQCMKASSDSYTCDNQRNQCLKKCVGG